MAFIDLARSRYSERRFSQTPIEPEKIDLILEAGRVAPTARNGQPQRILVVQSPEGLEKIDRCTDCRFGAPAVLVLAYDMTVASRHPDVVDFGVVDTSIVATHMMLQASELGVHSCWVGLIDPSELRRQFSVPSDFRIIGIMPLGYPSERSHPASLHARRHDASELFFRESYGRQAPLLTLALACATQLKSWNTTYKLWCHRMCPHILWACLLPTHMPSSATSRAALPCTFEISARGADSRRSRRPSARAWRRTPISDSSAASPRRTSPSTRAFPR